MDDTSTTPIPPATPDFFGETPGAFGNATEHRPTLREMKRKGKRNAHRNARLGGLTRLSFRRWLAVQP